MSDKGITLEGLAAAVDALRQELATWKALAHKQDQLSADQITATQSGATATKISQIAVNTAAIQSLAAQVAGQISLEYVTTLPATGEPLTLYLVPQGDGTAPNFCNEYLWINNDWELIGTTGAMANNGELTIQVNGVTVGTFTANQAANAAVNITVPTNTSQLVNGAGYVDAAALQAALALKQNSLNTAQLEAVNSGITAAAVQQIADNATAISGKQDALTTAQQAAVDSGATVAKIDQIAANASAIVSLTSSKQDSLSTTQLAAVNSGVTAAAVQQISTNADAIAGKAADSEVVHLAGAETISGGKTFTGAVVTHNITPETDNTYSLGSGTYRWAGIKTAEMTCWGTYVYQTGITAAAQGTQSTAINYSVLSAITTDATANFFCRQQVSISSALTQYALYLRMYDSNGDLIADNAVIYRLTSSGLNIFPRTSGTADLGTSTNNWKSVYANTYYYGGTEFSDKFWTADTVQSFTVSKHLKAVNLKVGQGESYGRTGYSLVWTDKNDVPVGYIDSYKNSNAARTVLRIRAGDYYTNGTPDSEGTQVIASLRVGTLVDSTRVIEAEVDAVYPVTNNATDLGTSSNKWKSFNGINPGALSLPNLNYSNSNQWIDISGNITQLTGGDNWYYPTVDGWVFVITKNNPVFLNVIVFATTGKLMTGASGVVEPSSGAMWVSCPAPAGSRVRIRANNGSTGAIESAQFILCQGNV